MNRVTNDRNNLEITNSQDGRRGLVIEQLGPLFLPFVSHFSHYVGRLVAQSEQLIEAQEEGHAIELKSTIEDEDDAPEQGEFAQRMMTRVLLQRLEAAGSCNGSNGGFIHSRKHRFLLRCVCARRRRYRRMTRRQLVEHLRVLGVSGF